MAQSILYYPTINIEDGPWLRSAVLYWDRVCSIVPNIGYYDFSPEIDYLMDRNQYRPIYAQEILYSQNADSFSREVQMRFHRMYLLPRRKYSPRFSDPISVHYAKIPDQLQKTMLEEGIARYSGDGDWLEIDSKAAHVYLRTLTEYIINTAEENIVAASDKTRHFDDLYYRTLPTDNTAFLDLSILNLLPVPSPDVGFEAIVDFKLSRKDELDELHRKLHELERNIAHSESRAEIKTVISDFKMDWERELRSAEKLFCGDGMGFALESLGAFVEIAGNTAGIAQLITQNHFNIGAVVGTGMIGMGIKHRNYRKKIKKEQEAQGFAYIIGAGRNGMLRNYEIL